MEVAPAIALPTFDAPRASIIVVTTGAGVLLERCLERLAATITPAIPFETIIVVNSTQAAHPDRLRARVTGARVEACGVNLGLAGALNRGRLLAGGEFLVSVHDDVEVEPGWLEALVAAAERDPRAGAVGSLVLDPDGGVQAAGWELLPDGGTRPPRAGREVVQDRLVAGAAYPVDYCPSCSLLVRAASWDRAGGADERLFPAYYVDVDICLAIRARGELVLCEPRSVVRHHRGASTPRDFARFISERNRTLMVEKWGTRISEHVPGSGASDEQGSNRTDPPRPVREPDAERQARSHLDRAASLGDAYAADLRARLESAEAELASARAELTRLRGECDRLRDAHAASERDRAMSLVFLVLAAQYESWSDPIAIILTVPMALVGIVVALLVRRFPDDLYTQIGLILMIALAAKNAILIVEFARELTASGMSPEDAAVEATRRRFRPIVMTSIAFILGVVPLMTATGAGAASQQSLGTVVFGGMVASTLLAIPFVPVFFILVRRMRSSS